MHRFETRRHPDKPVLRTEPTVKCSVYPELLSYLSALLTEPTVKCSVYPEPFSYLSAMLTGLTVRCSVYPEPSLTFLPCLQDRQWSARYTLNPLLPFCRVPALSSQIINTVSSMHLNNSSGDWKLLKGKEKTLNCWNSNTKHHCWECQFTIEILGVMWTSS